MDDRAWNDLRVRHRFVCRPLALFHRREVDAAGRWDVRDARRPGPRRPLRVAIVLPSGVTPARWSDQTRAYAGSSTSAPRIATASPAERLVSSTVKDIVAGSSIGFEERGEHELAGVPDPWRFFAATP
jgi:hypothetical protein